MSVRVLGAGSAARSSTASPQQATEEISADQPHRRQVSWSASRRPLIVLAVALMCAGAGIGALRASSPSVTTDNAYLKCDSTVVAPQVKGQVAEVLVAENAVVEKGQPLLRIDPEEYAARVSSAQGDLALADAQVAAAHAAQARWRAATRSE
jgi:membrane fusion protein (multidrug efflux system)